MKKIIYTILFVLLIALSFSVNAEESSQYSNLKALGITAEEIGATDMNIPATRKELAYIASKLADGKTYKDTETVFEDVSENTKLTGYIANAYNLGILNGKDTSIFAPEEFVTADAVYKVFSIVSGYTEFAEMCGGYPEGYRRAAAVLGVSKYISTNADGNVTLSGMFAAADALLGHEYESFIFSINNGEVNIERTSVKRSVFAEVHGINIYRGVITDINDESFSATVTITENMFESNKVKYAKGTTVTMPSNKNINLYEIENAPVTLWINSDKKIVNAELQRGVEILFGTVDAVNSDANEASEYMGSYIDYISLYNDNKNYRTTADFKVRYNLSDANVPVKLINKFARLVLCNGELTFLETWELNEGGIITEITSDHISYIQGDNASKRVSDIDLMERLIIYSDNAGVDINHLKTNTYFDYFRYGNKLVIIASEKRITDKLISAATDGVKLGEGKYKIFGDVYVQDAVGTYQKNGDYSNLLNKTVTAYFDAKGYCRYIGLTDENEVGKNKFLGLILGSRSGVFGDNTELKVISLEGEHENRVLKLKKSCTLNCGKTLSEILSIQDTTYAQNVLEFILNDKDEIIEIKTPEMFYGFPTAKQEISQFTYDSTAYVTVDGQYLYFKNAPIALILEKDGELYVKTESWNNLYGKRGNNITMSFFGNGMSSDVRLVLISGDTSSIYSRESSFGYVTDKSTVLNENGEATTQITVTASSQKDYIITDKDVADIAAGNSDGSKSIDGKIYFINYSTLYYGKSNLKINSSVSLDDIFADPAAAGWTKATVYKADSKRLFIDGNPVEAYFYHGSNVTVKVQPDGTVIKINAADISAGDTVYFKRDTEGIKGIIVE